MYNTMLDICFPGIVVVALYRSFLAPLLVGKRIPRTLQAMLTCPLCFGFHVTWIWLAMRYFVFVNSCGDCNSLGEDVSLLHWITLPFIGGLFSYVLEHVVTLITVVEQSLNQFSSQEAFSNDLDQEDVVERRRRG